MSASPIIALREAMMARLVSDDRLVAMLGGKKVHDEAARSVEPPYVVFTDVQLRDWSTQLSRGAEQFATLSVYSTQRGAREAIDIGQRIADLLDEATLTLKGHKLIDLRFVAMESKREQNGRFARVNLRFRATTEEV